jgi:hypothetical protein
MMIASGAFRKRITVFMKPSSIMDARVSKPTTRAPNCAKRARIAGSTVIVGGTKTATAGAPSATGMTMITIEIVTAIARHVKT